MVAVNGETDQDKTDDAIHETKKMSEYTNGKHEQYNRPKSSPLDVEIKSEVLLASALLCHKGIREKSKCLGSKLNIPY